ncbi:ribosome maturation factor RimP [bacterium]|nr:ribosome maturation factor RimP [bacterium]
MTAITDKVLGEISPLVEAEGFEVVDVEWTKDLGRNVLRVYLDKEGGVNLDDCSKVSQMIDTVIDVKCDIPHRYDLEVSSPGVNRPLKKKKHFEAALGKMVKVKTQMPIDGRQNYKGVLKKLDEKQMVIEIDKKDFLVPFDLVLKANLEVL